MSDTMENEIDNEVAAIGLCLRAVEELELSQALRVVGYVCAYIGVTHLSEAAYHDARRAALAEGAASAEEVLAKEQAS